MPVPRCFRPRSPCLAAAMLLAFAAWPTQAQSPVDPPLTRGRNEAPSEAAMHRLQDIVISSSRTEQRREDVPASVEVLDRKALEEQQVNDIRDATRYLPNVTVPRAPARFSLAGSSIGRDGNAGFNIRGLDGNRVLLLTDGLRLPRSYVFGANAFGRDSVDVGLLKRIEIIKGPASALYGSDSLAGLVNFITVGPADFTSANKPWGGRVSLAYSGDDEGIRAGATLAGRVNEAVQWLVSGSALRSSALDTMGTVDAANTDRTTPNPQTNRGQTLFGKLLIRPSAGQLHTLTFEDIAQQSRFDLLSTRSKPPLGATSVLSTLAEDTRQRQRLTWVADWQIDSLLADRVQTVVSRQVADARQVSYEDRNTAIDRVRDTVFNEGSWQLGVQASKRLRISDDWAQRLTYGLDVIRTQVANLATGIAPAPGESFPLKRFPDTTETTQAVYLQNDIHSEAWSIVPGIRYDRFSLDASQVGFLPQVASLQGGAVSPKLGVIYRFNPQWSVFANYASGFRAPNAAQVNAFFESFTAFYRTIPNPDLRPEQSQNLELGARARLPLWTMDAAVFTGRFKDLIADAAQVGGAGVPGNPTIFQSINIGRATISGFEMRAVYQAGTTPWGRLTLPFAYGQTSGRDDSTGRPINSINPATAVIGARLDTARGFAQIDVLYQGAKRADSVDSAALVAAPNSQFLTPSAVTVDVSGQIRLTKTVRVNLALINLTDRKVWRWSDVRGLASNAAVVDAFTQPGRHMNVSLVADF